MFRATFQLPNAEKKTGHHLSIRKVLGPGTRLKKQSQNHIKKQQSIIFKSMTHAELRPGSYSQHVLQSKVMPVKLAVVLMIFSAAMHVVMVGLWARCF